MAERIAAVLRERRSIGEERRRQEREYQRRNAERALARHYRLRGEAEQVSHRKKELDAACDARIFSNAADEALQEHGMTAVCGM